MSQIHDSTRLDCWQEPLAAVWHSAHLFLACWCKLIKSTSICGSTDAVTDAVRIFSKHNLFHTCQSLTKRIKRWDDKTHLQFHFRKLGENHSQKCWKHHLFNYIPLLYPSETWPHSSCQSLTSKSPWCLAFSTNAPTVTLLYSFKFDDCFSATITLWHAQNQFTWTCKICLLFSCHFWTWEILLLCSERAQMPLNFFHTGLVPRGENVLVDVEIVRGAFRCDI